MAVKEAYQSEVSPSQWKSILEGDFDEGDQEFLHLTNSLVEEVLDSFILKGKLARLSEGEKEDITERIWNDSQVYWWELSSEAKPIISFVTKLFKISKDGIEQIFPYSKEIFGENAEQLIFDLVNQAQLWHWMRTASPGVIDRRRMINIGAQIVEAIFSDKMNLSYRIGELNRKLFTEPDLSVRSKILNKWKKCSKLFEEPFPKNFNTVTKIRNDYSHASTKYTKYDKDLDKDYQRYIDALLILPGSVLTELYAMLNKKSENN